MTMMGSSLVQNRFVGAVRIEKAPRRRAIMEGDPATTNRRKIIFPALSSSVRENMLKNIVRVLTFWERAVVVF